MKNTFSASKTFFGGSALLIEYNDVIKPVYLTAIIKMIMDEKLQFGLPFHTIKSFSLASLVEWYKNRHYINPIKVLDYKRLATNEQLQKMLQIVLKDQSIYRLTPMLDSIRLIAVSEQNQLNVPIYVYSEQNNPHIQEDLKQNYINANYIFGPIKQIVEVIPSNATFIFSNIDLVKEAIEQIDPKKSANFIVVSDYGYNFSNNHYKHDFGALLSKLFKPFIVVNNISIFNNLRVITDYLQLLKIK